MPNKGNGCPTEAPFVYTNRMVGVKTNSPTKDFDCNGSLRSVNAFVDSVLKVWQLIPNFGMKYIHYNKKSYYLLPRALKED